MGGHEWEADWYKNAGLIYDLMKEKYFISEELLEKFCVYHFLDCLEFKEQLELINHLYKEDIDTEVSPYYNIIKAYYDENKEAILESH